jgi:hypothetical protein
MFQAQYLVLNQKLNVKKTLVISKAKTGKRKLPTGTRHR